LEVDMGRRLHGWILAGAWLACGGAAAQVGLGFLAETPMARFNDDDIRLMNGAIDKALAAVELGTPVRWANEATSSSGEVTAERAFERMGRPCRDLRVVNRHRRLENSGVYTLCREDGQWKLAP
jgi:surface antigen